MRTTSLCSPQSTTRPREESSGAQDFFHHAQEPPRAQSIFESQDSQQELEDQLKPSSEDMFNYSDNERKEQRIVVTQSSTTDSRNNKNEVVPEIFIGMENSALHIGDPVTSANLVGRNQSPKVGVANFTDFAQPEIITISPATDGGNSKAIDGGNSKAREAAFINDLKNGIQSDSKHAANIMHRPVNDFTRSLEGGRLGNLVRNNSLYSGAWSAKIVDTEKADYGARIGVMDKIVEVQPKFHDDASKEEQLGPFEECIQLYDNGGKICACSWEWFRVKTGGAKDKTNFNDYMDLTIEDAGNVEVELWPLGRIVKAPISSLGLIKLGADQDREARRFYLAESLSVDIAYKEEASRVDYLVKYVGPHSISCQKLDQSENGDMNKAEMGERSIIFDNIIPGSFHLQFLLLFAVKEVNENRNILGPI